MKSLQPRTSTGSRRQQQRLTFYADRHSIIFDVKLASRTFEGVMKKLLASLLFIPFLIGVNLGTAAPGNYTAPVTSSVASVPGVAAAGATTLSSAAAPAAQPSLPGHLATGVFTAAPVLLETGAGHTWRVPTRSGRAPADPLHHSGLTAEARTHIDTVRRSVLEFEHTLARARTNEPASFGNPPPASLT